MHVLAGKMHNSADIRCFIKFSNNDLVISIRDFISNIFLVFKLTQKIITLIFSKLIFNL